MASDQFVIVLTTLPAEGDAEGFASQLVEERLAACVNILPPMRSVYRWKGSVERADERQVVIKTTAPRIAALEARVRALHPYDLPEFVVIPIVQGSAGYLAWLTESHQVARGRCLAPTTPNARSVPGTATGRVVLTNSTDP